MSASALAAYSGIASSEGLLGAKARVLMISSDTQDGGSIGCSATLLKLGNSCRLLTNAHCAPNANVTWTKSIVWVATTIGSSDPNFSTPVTRSEEEFESEPYVDWKHQKMFNEPLRLPYRNPVRPQTVRVLRRSYFWDLSELEIPYELVPDCATIVPSASMAASPANASFALLGHVERERVSSFSDFTPWDSRGVVAPVVAQMHGKHARFWELQRISVYPGMSGGLVAEFAHGPAGILARYYRFDDRALVVPLSTVQGWLAGEIEEPREIAKAVQGSRSAIEVQPGRGQPVGDNPHINGGGDSRRNTLGETIVTDFAEPLEGVESAEFPGRRLLAWDDRQVDGWDDYLSIVESVRSAPEKSVFRPISGYTALELRRSLLARLAGNFKGGLRHGRLLDHGGSDNRTTMEETHVGNEEVRLAVDAEKNEITIQFAAHDVRFAGRAQRYPLPVEARQIRFDVGFDPEFKTVRLTSDNGETLFCDNRNHFKLICHSDRMSLSISVFDPRGGQAYFGFAEIKQGQYAPEAEYHRGILSKGKAP